jgi:hypothetical protein
LQGRRAGSPVSASLVHAIRYPERDFGDRDVRGGIRHPGNRPASEELWAWPFAELHWYEASGIGRKEFKIKRLL